MRFCLWLLWAGQVLQLRPGPLPDYETGACLPGSPWPACFTVLWAEGLGPGAQWEGWGAEEEAKWGLG